MMEERLMSRPRVQFEEPDSTRAVRIRKSACRSTSGNEPTFMSPLSFENVDVKNTPLSSLRSCSEYNRTQSNVKKQKLLEESSHRTFFSAFFGKQKSKLTDSNEEAEYFIEKFRFNQANLYDGEDYNYERQDTTDNCLGNVIFDSSHSKNRLKNNKVTFWGESSVAFDYLFGLKVGKSPQMEIELKNFNEPRLLNVYIARDGNESEHLENPVPSEADTRGLRRISSLRNFERVSVNENVENVLEINEGLELDDQSFSFLKRQWSKLVGNLRSLFPQSRGDELFYDSIRLQPFSSGAYLRCMLLAGLSSTFFQIYNLMSWPGAITYSPVSIYLQRILFINLWLQIILNILQLPFRLHIHFLCWESSRAVEVDSAINLIRTMLRSESWLLNKSIGKLIDFFIVINLLFTEVYLWTTRRDDPLRTLVISLCATNLLTVVSRVVVATFFAFSMHDPFVLSEARRRGLSKWDLEVLPTFVFTSSEDVNNTECPICLCGFEMGEMLISLPCDKKHSFHANCIRQWLQRQNSCPLCQRIV
jgi:hypothetical protein